MSITGNVTCGRFASLGGGGFVSTAAPATCKALSSGGGDSGGSDGGGSGDSDGEKQRVRAGGDTNSVSKLCVEGNRGARVGAGYLSTGFPSGGEADGAGLRFPVTSASISRTRSLSDMPEELLTCDSFVTGDGERE